MQNIFKNQSEKLIKTGNKISYMNKVARKLMEESLRSQKYLDARTENKITIIILRMIKQLTKIFLKKNT